MFPDCYRRILFGLTFVLSLVSFSASTILGQAAAKPTESSMRSFSGTWVMETIDIEHPLITDKNKPKFDWIRMMISHTEPQIKVERETKRPGSAVVKSEMVYYTDGRGETRPSLDGGWVTETKTRWKKGNLVLKGTDRDDKGQNSTAFTETWQMSPDGQTLTIITEHSMNQYRNGTWAGSWAFAPKTVLVLKRVP
jgi:hypothetical protein